MIIKENLYGVLQYIRDIVGLEEKLSTAECAKMECEIVSRLGYIINVDTKINPALERVCVDDEISPSTYYMQQIMNQIKLGKFVEFPKYVTDVNELDNFVIGPIRIEFSKEENIVNLYSNLFFIGEEATIKLGSSLNDAYNFYKLIKLYIVFKEAKKSISKVKNAISKAHKNAEEFVKDEKIVPITDRNKPNGLAWYRKISNIVDTEDVLEVDVMMLHNTIDRYRDNILNSISRSSNDEYMNTVDKDVKYLNDQKDVVKTMEIDVLKITEPLKENKEIWETYTKMKSLHAEDVKKRKN